MMNNRRNNYAQKSRASSFISNSMCGFLFTVDGDDKRALREAYSVIDHFVPKQAKDVEESIDNVQDSSAPKEDVSDILSNMCKNNNSANKSRKSGILAFDTGVKHTFFFTVPNVITPENVYSVVDAMVDDCQKVPRCRFLARVVPIEDTCVGIGNVDDLSDRIEKLIAKNIQSTNSDEGPSYAVDFRARNSDLISRGQAIDLVTTAMGKMSPTSRVNLTKPDVVILINVMRKAILLSCVRRYAERNRFSVRPPNASDTGTKPTEAGDEP